MGNSPPTESFFNAYLPGLRGNILSARQPLDEFTVLDRPAADEVLEPPSGLARNPDKYQKLD